MTRPWSTFDGSGIPFWEMLPSDEEQMQRERFEERAAIMEFHGGMSHGHAEQAAYAFMFADTPEQIAAFVPDSQVETQLLRASIIRGRREIELHAESLLLTWEVGDD